MKSGRETGMWREPRLEEIEAPKEYKKLINASIFYNRKGALQGATGGTIYQYIFGFLIGSIMLGGILAIILGLIFQVPLGSSFNVLLFVTTLVTLAITGTVFLYWGWYKYEQAWYHFNDSDRVFTVITQQHGEWEMFEIPYDVVDRVEWSGGGNGYAIIHAGGFKFNTTRAGSERFASVTELWNKLALFDTYMANWPITMECPQCDREFGHHIGTAQCPFDDMLLIDSDVKGRIDPEEMHPDDVNRV